MWPLQIVQMMCACNQFAARHSGNLRFTQCLSRIDLTKPPKPPNNMYMFTLKNALWWLFV